jgi:renalase
LERRADGWHAAVTNHDTSDDDITLGPFHRVVVAVPAEQVGDLVRPHAPDAAHLAAGVRSDPCWAGLFAFARPPHMPFAAVEFAAHPVLGFVADTASKPGRADVSAFVVHATPDWSRAHLEDPPERVAGALLEALCGFSEGWSPPVFAAAHRWRYARVPRAAGAGFLWDATIGLGIAGDWLKGPRIENAFVSGHGLASAMLA